VVCLEDGPLVRRLRKGGHPVEVVPTSGRWYSLLAAARRLRRIVRRHDPQVVHANGIKAALVAAGALVGTRTPLIWVKHDFSRDGALGRVVASRCDQIVGVSAAVTEALGHNARARVRVVQHGIAVPQIDRAEARARLVAELGEEPGPLLGVIGRLDPAKGHREIVEIVPELRRAHPNVRVLLVGDDDPNFTDHARLLRARVDDLGLGATVRFLGHRPDAVDIIATCDVVAVPSVAAGAARTEGASLVSLEAMAVGTPVVAYASGGIPEVVGECALLVPPGDRRGLAAAIGRLFDDPSEWKLHADCGRERVRRELSLERMRDAMLERYREAVP
jgi:glycosyltransferase involved in cell wall biosynthesis